MVQDQWAVASGQLPVASTPGLDTGCWVLTGRRPPTLV